MMLLGLSISSFAQGKLFTGIDLAFHSNDAESHFGLTPHFGYDLSDKMALVVGINIGSHKDKIADTKTSEFGVGAELRYSISMGDKFNLYLAPGVAYNTAKDAAEVETKEIDIRVAPGFTYMIGEKWNLNSRFGRIGYNSTTVGDGDAFGTFGIGLSMSDVSFGLEYRF